MGKTCSSDFAVDVKLLVPSVLVREFEEERSREASAGPTVAPGDPKGGAGPPSPACVASAANRVDCQNTWIIKAEEKNRRFSPSVALTSPCVFCTLAHPSNQKQNVYFSVNILLIMAFNTPLQSTPKCVTVN